MLIAVLPGFELHARHPVLAVLWLAVVCGVLSALVRPALEFLFLPYLLQSLGLVVIVIGAALLALLGLSSTLEIDVLWALTAGAVVSGVLGFVLDSLLGLTPPVVDDATARSERRERTLRVAAVSERLRLIQLYGLLLQYTADVVFDRPFLRPFRRRMQQWMWRPAEPIVPLPPQVKARLLLEDLGPTYFKLGQIVSSQGRALPLHEFAEFSSHWSPLRHADGCCSETRGGTPAYRPATEKALETGLFVSTRFADNSSGSPRSGDDCGLRGSSGAVAVTATSIAYGLMVSAVILPRRFIDMSPRRPATR